MTTVADSIEKTTARLGEAGLFFGHGTAHARDEAAWLVLHVAGAALDGSFSDWGRAMSASERVAVEALVEQRISSGKPLAYLLGEAWFAGLPFTVSEDVLVPRSPVAELILDGFAPWLHAESDIRALDMCTGSGCIAVAMAAHFPGWRVDAADISQPALRVAEQNIRRHDVADRVQTIHSDLFQSVPPLKYDLIVANPPYVPAASLQDLPREYRSEPALGLVSGHDGLDAPLEILASAAQYLADDGLLFCEVGESEAALAGLLPAVPFLWLEFRHGGSGVFMLSREELAVALPAITAAREGRDDVA